MGSCPTFFIVDFIGESGRVIRVLSKLIRKQVGQRDASTHIESHPEGLYVSFGCKSAIRVSGADQIVLINISECSAYTEKDPNSEAD